MQNGTGFQLIGQSGRKRPKIIKKARRRYIRRKRNMRKKLLAMMLATAMGLSLTACGGEGGDGGSSGDGGVSITIFNSKSEVQSQFEAMAEEYSKT